MGHYIFERLADECVDLYRIIFRRHQHLNVLLDPTLRIGEMSRAIEEQRTARSEMEVAVDRILGAAERMIAVDFSDSEKAAEIVADCCGEIMEACSFQDITGQRIAQTIETLGDLVHRLSALENDCSEANATAEKSSLLNGPALPGKGLAQDMADNLLAAGEKS